MASYWDWLPDYLQGKITQYANLLMKEEYYAAEIQFTQERLSYLQNLPWFPATASRRLRDLDNLRYENKEAHRRLARVVRNKERFHFGGF